MKTPKIRLLEDRVLVQPIVEEQKTDSGIILHLSPVRELPIMATVIAVGPELDDRLFPGDTIYYRFGEGLEIELEGEKYIVIRETGILVVKEPRAIDSFMAIRMVRELADWGLTLRDDVAKTPLMMRCIGLIYPDKP